MITPNAISLKQDDWQKALARAIKTPEALAERLGLALESLPTLKGGHGTFPIKVTDYWLGLIEQGNPNDPLLRQILPDAAELLDVDGFVADPVDDDAAYRGNGVIQKYQGRALLITTGACAIHCRYCFRRHYPYDENSSLKHLSNAVDLLANDTSLSEVILSGGDPLSLSDRRLSELLDKLEAIPHIKRIRLHTRTPVVLPQRISDSLIERLSRSNKSICIVLHVNHPNEITQELAAALAPLKHSGISLLNQSVLLKGINDSSAILRELSEKLFPIGVLPYYCHLLDPVQGAAHFNVEKSAAEKIEAELKATLSGYLVPKFVREVPHASSKVTLADCVQ